MGTTWSDTDGKHWRCLACGHSMTKVQPLCGACWERWQLPQKWSTSPECAPGGRLFWLKELWDMARSQRYANYGYDFSTETIAATPALTGVDDMRGDRDEMATRESWGDKGDRQEAGLENHPDFMPGYRIEAEPHATLKRRGRTPTPAYAGFARTVPYTHEGYERLIYAGDGMNAEVIGVVSFNVPELNVAANEVYRHANAELFRAMACRRPWATRAPAPSDDYTDVCVGDFIADDLPDLELVAVCQSLLGVSQTWLAPFFHVTQQQFSAVGERVRKKAAQIAQQSRP